MRHTRTERRHDRWGCPWALGAFVLLVCDGCRAPESHPAQADAAAQAPADELSSRPEAVAAADALAVAGQRKGGAEGAELTRRAADLRRRLWRMERREADALEAIELYRSLEPVSWAGACNAALDRVLLEGELRSDPAETYAQAYVLRRSATEHACRERADAVLASLAAWKPLPTALAELERRAGEQRKPVADARAPEASAATVRMDPSGPVIVPVLSSQRAHGPVRITNIERYAGKDAARVVVFVSEPTVFEVGFLTAEPGRGPRLFVDIEHGSYRGKLSYDVGGIVQAVRVGERKSGTRVVLDLASDAYRRVFYLPEPFRLVIDVSKDPPESVPAVGRGPIPLRRIVLDPGHGGHDPGATGPGGLREKDVTLDIAHRAAPLIARELGVATLLTRDSDDYVALDERTARANAFQADLFVSIHCNASEDGGGRGLMTFVLDESRDTLASRIAARENAASQAAGAELATALSQVLDVGSRARSLHFAELLQRASLASLSPHYADVVDQGIRRAGFYVLAGARMPAVLFETSFISNAEGEARLNTGEYRQRLADGIVNAVRAYREGK